MSKLSQLKSKVHYQEHVPRCSTCKHFKQKSMVVETGAITWVKHCEMHGFIVKTHACCDSWESPAGEVAC
jgi:hypothetical protein